MGTLSYFPKRAASRTTGSYGSLVEQIADDDDDDYGDEGSEVTLVRRSLMPAILAAAETSASTAKPISRIAIDFEAIVQNARRLKTMTSARLLPILKSDAYGHGIEGVAKALAPLPFVDGFIVTSVRDALRARESCLQDAHDKPIIVLTPFWEGRQEEVLLSGGLVPVLASMRDVEVFAFMAKRLKLRDVRVHLKIDTGMGRLGVRAKELSAVLAKLKDSSTPLVIDGLCTHLSSADEQTKNAVTARQLATFRRTLEQVRASGHPARVVHVANSAAAFAHREAHFSHLRAGIALFGGDPASPGFSPALSWRTHVVQLRTIEAGEPVSYSETWRAKRNTIVATLPIGYAHGFPRRCFNRTPYVLICGRRCPVIGRVCMEMMLVDVTDVAAVEIGDDATLIGTDQSETIRALDLASSVSDDCIVEEIFCGLSKPRS